MFTFGAKDPTRVSQLSFYMDRYNQMRETQAYGDHSDFDTDIRRLLKDIHHAVATHRLLEKAQSDFPRLIEVLDKKE